VQPNALWPGFAACTSSSSFHRIFCSFSGLAVRMALREQGNVGVPGRSGKSCREFIVFPARPTGPTCEEITGAS